VSNLGHLTFQYGSTTSLSTAADVNAAGRGVAVVLPATGKR